MYHQRPSEYVEGDEYYSATGTLGEDGYVQEPGLYAAARGVPPAPYATGAAAPSAYTYRRPELVYGRPDEYGYDGGRPAPTSVYGRPPPPPSAVTGYESEPQRSDLGMGAHDSRIVDSTDYGAGYGRPDLTTPYATAPGYTDGSTEAQIERLQNRVERERRHKHEAEAVAAAAAAYGLYERHEKHNAEDEAAAAQSRYGYPAAAPTTASAHANHERRRPHHHRHHHRTPGRLGVD